MISAYEKIISLPFKIVLKPAPGWSIVAFFTHDDFRRYCFSLAGGDKAASASSTTDTTSPQPAGQTITELRKHACEPLTHLLDLFTYLEAGFTQGISYNEFLQIHRQIEAEYIKLGGVHKLQTGEKDWNSDSIMPVGLRPYFAMVRSSLGLVKVEWETHDTDLASAMKRAAENMQLARRSVPLYIEVKIL